MQLNVRDVAEMIEVDEKTIERWVRQRKLHAHRIKGQFLFDRLDLFELVVQHELPELSPATIGRILETNCDDSLERALEAGGVVDGVEGPDPESVWRQIVSLLPMPDESGRDALCKLFLTGDFFQTTALGDGIAIPHPRRPLVLPVPAPVAMLCRLKQPLEVVGGSNKPMDRIFVLVSPTVRSHLLLLAQFVRSLRNRTFDDLVSHTDSAQHMSVAQPYAVAS